MKRNKAIASGTTRRPFWPIPVSTWREMASDRVSNTSCILLGTPAVMRKRTARPIPITSNPATRAERTS